MLPASMNSHDERISPNLSRCKHCFNTKNRAMQASIPEQAQPSCIGAHIAPDVAAPLCPQVKRDHHPLVCQGGVKCFKDHPRLTYSHSGTWVNAFNVGHQPG